MPAVLLKENIQFDLFLNLIVFALMKKLHLILRIAHILHILYLKTIKKIHIQANLLDNLFVIFQLYLLKGKDFFHSYLRLIDQININLVDQNILFHLIYLKNLLVFRF